MSPAAPTRALAAALLSAGLLALAALPAAARAGNKADAFEGKIQPISGQLYRKTGRLELTLLGDLSVNDAFFTKYFGGLQVGWHLTEFWSLSASYATGGASPTDSTTVCPANQGCRPATPAELAQLPGRLHGVAGLEVAWTPVYGKLNVLAEKVGHFDLGVVAGADWIQLDQVLTSDQAVNQGLTPKRTSTVGGHVGLAARLFLGEAVALKLVVKDLVYAVDVPNVQENGRARSDVQNQFFTELGVSVFFPLTAKAPGRSP